MSTRTVLISLMTAAALILYWIAAVIYTVTSLAYGARRTWAGLEDALTERDAAFDQLAARAEQQFAYDPEIRRGIARVRQPGLLTDSPVRQVRRRLEQSRDMDIILQQMSRYPALLTNIELIRSARELERSMTRVSKRVAAYNRYATGFNQRRRDFACSTVTAVFADSDMPTFLPEQPMTMPTLRFSHAPDAKIA